MPMRFPLANKNFCFCEKYHATGDIRGAYFKTVPLFRKFVPATITMKD